MSCFLLIDDIFMNVNVFFKENRNKWSSSLKWMNQKKNAFNEVCKTIVISKFS